MKSQINLYTPELRPVKESLSLSVVLISWGGLLLLLALAHAVLTVLNGQQETVNEQQTEQNNSQQLLVTNLTSELSGQIEDPHFVKKQQELQTELNLKERLLRIYSTREDEKNQGFSGLLEGLATTSKPRLWLTRITLNGTKLSLEGAASDAAAIPIWVDGLKQSEQLAGREFATLAISRDEQEQLRFTLWSDEPPKATAAESSAPAVPAAAEGLSQQALQSVVQASQQGGGE